MTQAAYDKIGVYVAGGPAAGINGVVKGVVEEAYNQGIAVYGYGDGAHGLVHDCFVRLTRKHVEDIHFIGGSILGASRFNPTSLPGGMDRIVENLRRAGIDGLIAIGGEGTLQMANALRQRGVRIVHVPKTIDNDIYGISQSFGFDTAVHEASRLLTAVKLDAETSGLWFVVEVMGRFTGHLALEAGIAVGATRVLIPEEGPINVEELGVMMENRSRAGLNWGVIVVAESANFGEGYLTRRGRLGGIAEELADRLCAEVDRRAIPARLRTSNLGYFLRCADPTGFDKSYATKLGISAVQFLVDPALVGHTVRIEDDLVSPLPMEAIAGKAKPVALDGARYRALKALERYEADHAGPLRRATSEQVRDCLAWLDNHADIRTVRQLAMRLGMPEDVVVAALQDLIHVETGLAREAGHT